ncbi:MAG: PstS family phosphate ABC transporter substrate-binding protein [Spirochaetaceae bacterium]|nr:PstS family phosphate ABC transporter substrate-binding protein [Spirochaetaceae bacterium]
MISTKQRFRVPMSGLIVVFLIAAGLTSVEAGGNNEAENDKTGLTGTVSVSGAFALYPMVVLWVDEYTSINPGVRIDVSGGGAGKGMADALGGAVDFGMVSRPVHSEELQQGATAFPVTRDAVVGTLNSAHPAAAEILRKGIDRESLAALFLGTAGGRYSPDEFSVYTRSDSSGAAAMWARYLGAAGQEDLAGTAVSGDPGLLEAVRQDARGIGYNNINYAYSQETGKPYDGIEIIPLDLNGNGAIEKDERFYDNLDAVTSAIAAGDYPSPPARDLFLVSKGVPTNPAALEFLRWVLTDGQAYVEEAGYIRVRQEQLDEAARMLAR